ncbi:MAG: hypothetical protein GX649_00975 [Chloroflexi bacterium]|nr:hypothetical protein [Chloroflexota bacterium]
MGTNGDVGLLARFDVDIHTVAAAALGTLVRVRNGAGAGAGAVWHSDEDPATGHSLILTNAHVIGRRPPQVDLSDGRTFAATVVAADQGLDLAALRIDVAGLAAISLGDSRTLRPAQWVMAVGHPWGITGGLTAGVVIGSGRALPEMPLSEREWLALSLHLRPGHSGGPVVDAAGRLVGLNTVMVGPDVGLAVPVHVAKAFLKRALGAQAREGERAA